MYQNVVGEQEEYLLLSGIQHFAFCPRQWALIHIEGLWEENLSTVEGALMHERSHDAKQSELRGDILSLRSLRVFSHRLGITGACDVVEFHRCSDGVSLYGRKGLWQPFPVEYKRGKPKAHQADELQLCAQAMCIEEMLGCTITEGALFYGETKRRQNVAFDSQLREAVDAMTRQMHAYARRGHTPKVKPRKNCRSCSLEALCLPALGKTNSAAQWTAQRLKEMTES